MDNYPPITDVSHDEWQRIQDVNVKGTFNPLQPILKVVQRQQSLTTAGPNGARSIGRSAIVNVASALGFVAIPNLHSCTTLEHAVIGLAKTARHLDAFCPLLRCPCFAFESIYALTKRCSSRKAD